MDDLSRLRDQVGSLGGRPDRQGQQQGQGQQPGQQQGQGQGQQPGQGQGRGGQNQSSQLARSGQGGQPGQQGGQGQQPGQGGQGGANGQPGGQRNGGVNDGQIAGRFGGPNDGTKGARSELQGYGLRGRQGDINTGPTPADTERDINQGLNLLNGLRATVQDNPDARAQVQKLIDEMRNLDPKKFPGNPGLVDQMHQQLVSQIDALELQLRRQLDQVQGSTIRNTDPTKVPPGYQASVAEYYRKLSGVK
jgi:hypothetical protein